ncbi:solute carrier family 2, facilitated glucose transporter member 1-like isoform X1 [Anthonomus grandis grandis]|uniref:solute carrier family 2, facilitated glucose transporter member 1-like isoform X1 n=1 Tax=Anthonomus grandis grandis TaxID=2921223 RepID=UPI002165DE99|nr:solute carrier family 2, facilitated glucose transporter member 1-like isoform X1 [Anthonomus grandis grandis]
MEPAESEVMFNGQSHNIRPVQSPSPYRDITFKQPRWTRLLVLAGVVTVLGSSTPVGYNLGVINTAGKVISQFCNESVSSRYGTTLSSSGLNFLWSSIVSIFLVGGCIGSLTGSLLANKIGRKGGLATSSFVGVFSGICFLAAKRSNSVELLFIGRVFAGLSAGLITTIMPMYLMELAPSVLKGPIGAFCPLGVTTGVLLGQILSMETVLGNEDYWPHCLAFPALLQAICALAIPILPESPKYLFVIRKTPHLALKQLKRLRNCMEDSLTEEIETLRIEEQENLRQGEGWDVKKVLKSPALRLPLLLVCALQAGQQLSGVNSIFYYSSVIFNKAGFTPIQGSYATIGTGCCNLFMAAMSVLTMSWFQRRTILQLSLLSSTVCLILLGISLLLIDVDLMPYICIIAVLGYVLCYGLALGPIPYFVGSELFEVGPRSSAMALGSLANWAGNFIIAILFPQMADNIGAPSYFIFAAVVVALFIFIRIYLPETKGRDPCEIYHLVEHGFKSRPLVTRQSSGNAEMNGLTSDKTGF